MKEIISTRLIYEKIKKTDFFLLSSLYSNHEVMRYTYLDVCNESSAKEIFEEVCKEKIFTYFVVREKHSHQFIGFVFYNTTLEHKKWGIVSIGYILHPDVLGRWYATEMGKAMIDYLFATRPIHKLEANTHAKNLASEKILIKLGMKKEWVARKARYKNGEWWDEIHYRILREEWEKMENN